MTNENMTNENQANEQHPHDPESGAIGSIFCKGCGYNLSGLAQTGPCPECAFPIERSLDGDQLANASPDYVAKLLTGTRIILVSILAKVLFTIMLFGAGFASAAGGSAATTAGVLILISIGLIGLTSFSILLGWWIFSEPDPSYSGIESPTQARRVLRTTLVVQAASAVVEFAANMLSILGLLPANLGGLLIASTIIGTIAFVVAFFASMQYLRWLTPRIPNQKAWKRAGTLRWLVPVLYTVGSLCVGIGPLIALILYYNLIAWVKNDLKSIRSQATLHP